MSCRWGTPAPGGTQDGSVEDTGRCLRFPCVGGIWASRALPFAGSLASAPVSLSEALVQSSAWPTQKQQAGMGAFALILIVGSNYQYSWFAAERQLLLNPHNCTSHSGGSLPLVSCGLMAGSSAGNLPDGWRSLSLGGRAWAWGWRLRHRGFPGLPTPPLAPPPDPPREHGTGP